MYIFIYFCTFSYLIFCNRFFLLTFTFIRYINLRKILKKLIKKLAMSDKESSKFLDLRQKANCILLKVLPDSTLNEEMYHNNFVYYPYFMIDCDDTKEVC